MPRGRRSLIDLVTDDVDEISFHEKCKLVTEKLKNDYYEMCEKLEKNMECCICMENIDCKNCLALTNCGNTFHLNHYIRCNKCPICRN